MIIYKFYSNQALHFNLGIFYIIIIRKIISLELTEIIANFDIFVIYSLFNCFNCT